jgi:hypothetical protein
MARAAVVTTFDEVSLPAAISLDVPSATLGSISFDAVNDELDFSAGGDTDMWGARNNAPIAWTAIPTGLVNGSTWSVETEVRINNVSQNNQVAGLTFYGGPDGAKPDISFGLDNWAPAARAVRLQGLGDNDPNVGVATTASSVFLRVVIQEAGATDTYNFFFKVNAADAWTQLTGAALNYQTNFANSRVAMVYKTGAAKAGAAFTYFNVQDNTAQPPTVTAHPANLTAMLGGVGRFTISATGATSYQWRRAGVNIPTGGISAVYLLDPVTAGDHGVAFDCLVTNANGSVTSNPATLTVTNPPVGSGYYSSAVQAEPSLLAYFPVDGSMSPAVTNVKKPAFSGTLNGTAAHDSTAGRTIGSRSTYSDGGGWVSVTKDPEWNFVDGNGTIEMFVYHTAATVYNPSMIGVRHDGGGGTRYSIHADSAGTKIWFYNGSGAPTWALPTNSIGRLMHLVFVINNGQVTLYHNGTSLGIITQPLGPALSVSAEIGSAGPSAQESFPGNIDEVALYADPLPATAVTAHYNAWLTATAGSAPVVTGQPSSQAVNEGSSVTFTATLSDTTGAVYRWQRNGADIAGATAASYTLNPATLADHSAQFRCVIYNSFGGTLTNSATLTVNDINPPQLLSATSALSSQVILSFNEAVDLATASFSLIGGGTVVSATAGPIPGLVTLTVSGLTAGQNYTVTVNNVRDLVGNTLTTANTSFVSAPAPVPAPIELVRPGSEPAGPATRRGPYVFSEIHYHPRDRADLRNLEFIEIYNSQSWAEDLSGCRITGEVNYNFPTGTTIAAGGYLVVAAVPADIASAYGIAGVLGPWTGGLNNSGGVVRLRDISDGVVFEVEYDTSPPWPAAPDGSGHSLVLARPSYGMNDARAWDQSFLLDGSPGSAEPTTADPYRTVLINEVQATAAATGDFVELYNYSSSAVDLSDCSLSDDRDTAKYFFPAATSLPAGGFLALDGATLGFALNSAGDVVYLRAPNVGGLPGRVLDTLKFSAQRAGLTTGRSPDGGVMVSTLASPTMGQSNSVAAAKAAVISEILYHPPVGSSQLPFIEVTNISGAMLNLTGWRLRGGVSYDFPVDTMLAADGKLAVTAFTGTLNQGAGERLRLEQPETMVDGILAAAIYPTVDEVTYGTGGRWGTWSDGGGSSLERKDLHSDGRLASNWADSDETAESGWVNVEATGVLDNGSGAPLNRLHVMLLGAGECLLDDVEFIPSGGSNVITNGGFETSASNWLMQGTHDASSVQAGGFSGGNSLRIRAAGRGDLAGNRLTVPLNVTPAANSTGTIRAKVKWLRGHAEILLRLNGGVLEATGNILPNTVAPGTAGGANSIAVANAGPSISQVTHRPVLPQAGQPTTVYARLDDGDDVSLAILRYRLDPATSNTSIVMTNRGAGLYSAEIPAQAAGTLVAYAIAAYDSLSASSQFPHDAPTRECLIRWGEPTPAGDMGIYRIWMTEATRNTWTTRGKNSNTPLDATFIYGNSRIIYNASAQYSGSPFHTPGFNGPTGAVCDYDCNVPGDDRFLGETDILLAGPGTFGNDTSFVREQIAWWTARKLGLPSIHRRFCRVFVNGTQRQTVFEDTQQPGGAWINEYWPTDDDGHLHKAQDWIEYADDGATFQTDIRATLTKRATTGGAHKTASYRYQWSARSVEGSANDWADLTTLIDAHNTGTSGTDPTYLAAVDPLIDQDSWARAMAVQRIAGNWDTWGWRFGKNMYLYKPTRGPWALTCWDIDFSYGLTGEVATFSLFTDTQDVLADKFRANPKFLRAYWCAFREAVDGPLLGANSNARIDAMVAGLAANGITSNAAQITTVKTYVDARRTYILSQLDATYATTTLALSGSSTLTDADGLITLSGTAPPGVKTLLINGVAYTPDWSSATVWSLPLTLYSATNNLTVQGLSLSGTELGSFNVDIAVTGPPPVPAVKINEWMADNTSISGIVDPADGKFDDWFELHNAGPTAINLGGFYLTDSDLLKTQFTIPANTIIPAGGYLLVWADNDTLQSGLHANFKLSASGEMIGLYTPDGTQVDLITFGPQTANQSQSRYPDSGTDIIHSVNTPGKRNALPPDILAVTDIGSGTSQVNFSTEPTHSYQLQSTTDMATWSNWGAPVTATGISTTTNLPRNESRRFWKAQIVLP